MLKSVTSRCYKYIRIVYGYQIFLRGEDMTKKELQEIRDISIEIQTLEDEIRDLKTSLMYTKAQTYNDMPKSKYIHTDKMSELICRLIDTERKLSEKKNILLKKRIEIETIIDTLPPIERTVIRLKYFQGKKWYEIANITNYSERSVQRFHGYALQKLQNL